MKVSSHISSIKAVQLGYFCCDDREAAAGYKTTLLPAVQQVISSKAMKSDLREGSRLVK